MIDIDKNSKVDKILRVTYSKDISRDNSGVLADRIQYDSGINPEYSLVLDYKIKDTLQGLKFLDTIKRSLEFHKTPDHPDAPFNPDNVTKFSFNMYPSFDEEKYLKLKKFMNETIRFINDNQDLYKVDENLYLNDNETTTEMDKLNALHFYFEQTSIQLNETVKNDPAAKELKKLIYWHLESINQTVHLLERGVSRTDKSLYGVVRMVSRGCEEFYDMLDEDYNAMETSRIFGDMIVDYGTVGKDMWAAVITDDFGLIENKELKQQLYIHPMFAMWFGRDEPDSNNTIEENKNNWCIKNNVAEYYPDWQDPQYRTGRIRVASLMDTGMTREELLDKIVECNCISNVELIDV